MLLASPFGSGGSEVIGAVRPTASLHLSPPFLFANLHIRSSSSTVYKPHGDLEEPLVGEAVAVSRAKEEKRFLE